MPDQAAIVIAHFQRIISLARKLGELGTDVHSHEYDPHFAETWKIIAGSYRHRFQFRWDGHIRVLTVSEAFFDILGSLEGNWKELRKVNVSDHTDPFKYLEDFFST